MRKSRFTEEQIAFALKQAETGTPGAEVIRRMGVFGADLLPVEEALRRPWHGPCGADRCFCGYLVCRGQSDADRRVLWGSDYTEGGYQGSTGPLSARNFEHLRNWRCGRAG
jgi:hypothetical protein